uniref:Costars domain-containing protein n=1 Tax=Strongyloides papillosus TaxID=174720 RepID=A0A0N5C9B0_STREA
MVFIERKWNTKKIVVIKFAIGIVNKYKPFVGTENEINKKIKKLTEKNNREKKKKKCDSAKRLIPEKDVLNEVNKNSKEVAVENKCTNNNLMKDTMNKFKNMEIKEKESKKRDVYSSYYKPTRLKKDDPEYGTPIPGTLTELRAKKASKHIAKEMGIVCQVIEEYGKVNKKTGLIEITFGELFNIYTFISDKVVGILLRARKHNMLQFEGEMLYQRRDEDKIITLLLDHNQILNAVKG